MNECTTGPAARAAQPQPPVVTLLVVGPAGCLHELPGHLPAAWQLRWAETGAQPSGADMVLLMDADAGAVAQMLRSSHEVVVVAAVANHAPARTVVEILNAGAVACVRLGDPGGSAAIVAAHLMVCSRHRAPARASGGS